MTFDPTDLRVVVLLASKRIFWRFVGEHAGLERMLRQAFQGGE